MNIKKIKELIDLMNENELTEIEVEQEGSKIKLAKKGSGVIEQIVTPSVARSAGMPQQGAEALGSAVPSGSKEIKAPMVGTFYTAPSPDAEAYVKEGDIVNKGDVLCIIEAMKLMNEIKADFGGKVAEVCVENGEPVEFGQRMFLLEAV